jgi:tetratricopeptide (TPR) repeat protein
MSGLGSHHHPIRTTSREAQALFDQGVTLVFGFNHEEAVRAFQRAAALDSAAAMPHWGIAWALGPNYNLDVDDERARQAHDAIERAKTLAASGPDSERAYVDAMAIRFTSDPKPDRAALARRYSQAMRALVQRFPDDLDAATLYAESLMNLRPWKLWTLSGAPAEDTLEIMRVLEGVLARDPDHVGANHYYIHTVEASPNPGRALISARRLERLVPAAGHLVHMPAHIYARTGDHTAAAAANLAGAEADRAYLKTAPPGGFYEVAYYTHNLHFLADSHMNSGRLADARKAADDLASAMSPHLAMMPMGESMMTMGTSVLLRFGRYDELLGQPEPPEDRPVLRAWWRFARGVALARTGKPDEAAAERKALAETTAKVPDSALFGGTGLTSARSILGLAALVLDARIAEARGTGDRAVALWRQAIAEGDEVPYDEPPIWFYPLRESLGVALLAAGKPADAEQVFRASLERAPRNARALLGLKASLDRQGKESGWVAQAFETAWKSADSELRVEGL